MIDANKIKAIVTVLEAAAAIYAPGSAPAVAALLNAATQLNGLIGEIRSQTDADAQAVWDKVRTDYSDALAEFESSNPL